MGDYKRRDKPGRDRPNRGYGNKDFSRFAPRESRRESRPALDMHTVICSKCGKETEVPFKPTSGKPVFCRDCFRKDGKPMARGRSEGPSREPRELEEINRKLDKIMKALKIE